MNSYFFKMTNEEKNSILDQHKSLYDGYVTQYENSKEQPLYVQDFANDKAGITVNNKGEVGEYRNMRINEMRHDGKSTGLFDEDAQSGTESIPSNTFESDSYMVSVGEQLDMIGDGDDDLEHGTFDDDDENPSFDEEQDFLQSWGDEMGMFDDDDEIISSIQEQINKSLNMFKRFNTYL